MKKILSAIIVLALTLALIPMSVFAATDATVYTEVDGAKETVAQGKSFTYSIYLEGTYDGYSLQVNAVQDGLTVTSVTPEADVFADEVAGTWMFSVIGGLCRQASPKTKIATVTVKAGKTAPLGAKELGFTNISISTEAGDKAVFSAELASITVTEAPAPNPNGAAISGVAAAWNATDNAVYLLYDASTADDVIKAEWTAGTYETSDNVLYTADKDVITGATVDKKEMNLQPFTFEGVEDGTYKLVMLKIGKYVPKIIEITVDGEDVDVGQQKLWLYGDVNGDGSVKANDAAQIYRKVNNKSSVFDTGDAQTVADRLAAADVNGSGIKANDAAQINRKVNNKTSVFDRMK